MAKTIRIVKYIALIVYNQRAILLKFYHYPGSEAGDGDAARGGLVVGVVGGDGGAVEVDAAVDAAAGAVGEVPDDGRGDVAVAQAAGGA